MSDSDVEALTDLFPLWWLNLSLPDALPQKPRLPSLGTTYDPVWQVFSDGTTAEAAYRAGKGGA